MVLIDLEALGPFRHLSDQGRTLLRQGVVRKHCAPMEAVLHKGQAISGAYFVIRGRLRVYALAPDGTEATLYVIEPGETCIFALNSLFNDLRYPAWVLAETRTTVALIPGRIFRRLFEHEPAIQDVTVRALSTLVFRLMSELEEVHSYTLSQRLANLLLVHGSTQGELRMTQQDIARRLGTSREVIARAMRDFVKRRYVETGRGRTIVRNARGLADLLAKR